MRAIVKKVDSEIPLENITAMVLQVSFAGGTDFDSLQSGKLPGGWTQRIPGGLELLLQALSCGVCYEDFLNQIAVSDMEVF